MFKSQRFSSIFVQLVSVLLITVLPSTSVASVAGPQRISFAPVAWVSEAASLKPSPQLTAWARTTLDEFRKAEAQSAVAPARSAAAPIPASKKLSMPHLWLHQQFHGEAESSSFGGTMEVKDEQAIAAASPADSSAKALRGAKTSPRPSAEGLFARQPLHFEPNLGQADPAVNYLARGKEYQVLLTAGEALIVSHAADQPKHEVALRLTLDHAAPSAPQGRELLPGQSNYFAGQDASKWIRQVPNYAQVAYPGVYPGIDLFYYGQERALEYDFRLAAGADSSLIAFRFPDHPTLTLDDSGALQAELGGIEFSLQRPVAYQQIEGQRRPVAADFALNSDGSVGFHLGAYDRSLPLVIDPVVTLTYATYLGGTYGQDDSDAVKADALGNAYVMSNTHSTDFPVTSGAFQTTNTSASYIAAITKFDPTGTKLLYSTYLGNGEEFFPSLAINSAGQAVMAASASDPTFPTTANAYQANGFLQLSVVAQLDPTGTKLLYSTFFPFQTSSYHSVAEDDAGRIYIIGAAGTGVPITGTAYEPTLPTGAGSAAFLSEFDPSKSGQASLAYSTYLGAGTSATAVAVDNQQNAYVVGTVGNCFGSGCGPQYAPIKNAFQPNSGGPSNIYIVKVSTTATGDASLIYGSYLGGTGTDLAADVAVDSSNNAYITGYIESATNSAVDFPTTAGAYQTKTNLTLAAFVSKVSSDGKTLIYSTLLGGSATDTQGGTSGIDLAVDGLGQVQLLGSTTAPGFPVLNAYAGSPAGPPNGAGQYFVAGFNATASGLLYSTFVPNASFQAIAADPLGNVYLAGSAVAGLGFSPTSGAFQQTCVQNGYCGAVMKLNYGGSTGGGGGAVTIASVDPNEGGQEDIVHLTLSGAGFANGASLTLSKGTATLSATSVVVANGGGSLSGDVDLHGAALGAYSITVTNPDNSTAVASGAFTVVPTVAAIVTNTQGVAGSLATTSITAPTAEAGAVVTLAKNGSTVATATNVSIANGAVTATFDLTKVAAGVYDVVITNPDGGVITLPASFTIGLTGSSQPSIDIIGRTVLRGGQQQYYYIVIGNQGNEDAEMVHFRVKFPPYFQFTLGASLASIQTTTPLPANTVPYDESLVPPGQPSEDGTTAVDLYLPYVAAGQTYSIPFEFFVPDVPEYAHVPFVIDAEVDPGQFQPTPPTTLTSQVSPTLAGRRVIPMVAGGLTPAQNCLGKLALALLVIVPAFGGLSKAAWLAASGTAAGLLGSVVPFDNPLAIQPLNMSQVIWDVVAGALAIAGIAWPPLLIASAVISILNHLDTLKAAYDACKDVFPTPPPPCMNPPKKGTKHGTTTPALPPCPNPPKGNGRRHKGYPGSTVVSGDPNDKSGPIGAGTAQYIQGKLALPYGVYFENEATASAAAQTVVVTDQLDPTKVDLSTFNFGPVYIANQTLMPEPGSQNFTGQVDLRPANNIIASVTGNLNAKTGLLQWTFTSLDPATGKPVTDPTAGFLPPNTPAVSPQGDGAVSFNVKALSSVTTGTAITNQATVVFDQNAPIKTPVWSNTVDHDPPISKVTSLSTTNPGVFPLAWSGTDAGSGVAQYSIYASDNNGPFQLWRVEPGTSDTYNGVLGHRYAFYSIAEDFAGNIETSKTAAEATTTIATGSASTSIALTSTAMQILPSGTATITATVSGKNPTGNILFTINDVPQDPIALTGGAAAMDVSTLPAGPNDIVAFYSGDSANAPSTAGPFTITVLPAVTTLTLSAPTVAPGVAAKVTVTAANSAGAVKGGVQLTVNNQTYAVALTNNSGSVTLPVLPAGSYPMTAFFSGGGDQSQAAATGTLVVQQAISTTTLTSSATGAVTAGQSVTLTATVAGQQGIAGPTGSVQFSSGTAMLGTAQLSGAGVATLAVTTLPVGADTVTATYSGDGQYTGSSATLQIVVVAPPAPSFTLGVSAPALTVAGQGSGTETISITPQNGFNQQVALACSGAPQYATCTISPATVTPSGGTAATATLTISTGVSSAALASPGGFAQPNHSAYAMSSAQRSKTPTSPGPADSGKLIALCVLGLCGLARARRHMTALGRQGTGSALSLFLFAFALLCGSLLAGCGSSSHASTPPPTTPAGNSTITVTATAGSVKMSTTFTLTVN